MLSTTTIFYCQSQPLSARLFLNRATVASKVPLPPAAPGGFVPGCERAGGNANAKLESQRPSIWQRLKLRSVRQEDLPFPFRAQ